MKYFQSLNRWTLNFNQRDIENEYRAHFAAGDSSERHSTARKPTSGIEKHRQVGNVLNLIFLNFQLSTQLQRVGGGAHSNVARQLTGGSTAGSTSRRHYQQRRPRYRYSGVFIDIFVSAFIFLVSTLLFLLQPGITLTVPFLVYISVAALFIAGWFF